MSNIDKLIGEIRENEVVEIQGTLNADMQWRIEERILKTISEEPPKVIYKKHNRRKTVILIAAAVLMAAFGITSAAKHEWDIALINFMGLSDATTLQLEGGEVHIGARDTAKGITLTAETSIGDKNSAYIRLETDYELPKDFQEQTDYILPKKFSLKISDGREANSKGYGATWTYYAEDGKLCFLLAISNCERLNRSRIQLQIGDLYLYHDLQNPEFAQEEELLAEGNWELDWTYHYRSNAKTYHKLETFEHQSVEYYLTKIEVTPISVRIEAFRLPKDRAEARPEILIQKITYADGTSVDITKESSGGLKNGMFLDSYVDIGILEEPILTEEVKSITISGKEIELH